MGRARAAALPKAAATRTAARIRDAGDADDAAALPTPVSRRQRPSLYSAILAGPLQLTLRFIRREESLRLLQEPLRLVRLVADQRRRGDVDAPLRLVPVDFHCGGTGAAAHWTRSK